MTRKLFKITILTFQLETKWYKIWKNVNPMRFQPEKNLTHKAFFQFCFLFSEITWPFFPYQNLSPLALNSFRPRKTSFFYVMRNQQHKHMLNCEYMLWRKREKDHGCYSHHDTDIRLFRKIIIKAKLFSDNNTRLPMKL